MSNQNSFERVGNEKNKCELLTSISEELDLNNGKLKEETRNHIEMCPECKEYFQFWCMFETLKKPDEYESLTGWEEDIEVNKIVLKLREKREKRRRLIWGGIISFVSALLIFVLALLYFSFFNYDNSKVQATEIRNNPSVFHDNIPPFPSHPNNSVKNKDL